MPQNTQNIQNKGDDGKAARRLAHYWRRARRLTAVLLAAWFVGTFVVAFYARELSHVRMFGWPLSFFMAAQGLILVYLAIVGIYAWRMEKLDASLSGAEPGPGHD